MPLHDRIGFREVPARERNDPPADLWQRRMREHGGRIGGCDAGFVQELLRQIKPADPRVLIQVAQDVGQLQRATQMLGKQLAVAVGNPEHARREPPHRACHAVAIKIQLHKGRCLDAFPDIHLHAVDDGPEVVAVEIELADSGCETA